jgi:hypothetical protein
MNETLVNLGLAVSQDFQAWFSQLQVEEGLLAQPLMEPVEQLHQLAQDLAAGWTVGAALCALDDWLTSGFLPGEWGGGDPFPPDPADLSSDALPALRKSMFPSEYPFQNPLSYPPEYLPQHSPEHRSPHSPEYRSPHSPEYRSPHSPEYLPQHSPEYLPQHSPEYLSQHSPEHPTEHRSIYPADYPLDHRVGYPLSHHVDYLRQNPIDDPLEHSPNDPLSNQAGDPIVHHSDRESRADYPSAYPLGHPAGDQGVAEFNHEWPSPLSEPSTATDKRPSSGFAPVPVGPMRSTPAATAEPTEQIAVKGLKELSAFLQQTRSAPPPSGDPSLEDENTVYPAQTGPVLPASSAHRPESFPQRLDVVAPDWPATAALPTEAVSLPPPPPSLLGPHRSHPSPAHPSPAHPSPTHPSQSRPSQDLSSETHPSQAFPSEAHAPWSRGQPRASPDFPRSGADLDAPSAPGLVAVDLDTLLEALQQEINHDYDRFYGS